MDRTRSTFRVLHTPVTSAPNALASCTAKLPIPPDAPLTRTRWPGLDLHRRRWLSRVAWSDSPIAPSSVLAEIGMRDRAQAVVFASESGLVEAGEHGMGQ